MRSHTAYLTFNTPERCAIVNINTEIEAELTKSGIKEGLCLVNAMHNTSSVFINDNDSGLQQDILEWVEKLAPYDLHGYKHNLTWEDNADSHLKRTIMGREAVVAVTGGKLDFGPYEKIFYGEFEGKRDKRVLVKIIGE